MLVLAGSGAFASEFVPNANIVPPPHPEVLIPAPLYTLNSQATADGNSLLRPNAGVQSPGMNIYRPLRGEHIPPVFTQVHIMQLQGPGPYDLNALDAYSSARDQSTDDSDNWQRLYEERSERLRQMAPRFVSSQAQSSTTTGAGAPVYFTPPPPYYYAGAYGPDPFFYPGFFAPRCVPSFGIGVGGRGHVHSSFGISCL
jgi:hypothetical protein